MFRGVCIAINSQKGNIGQEWSSQTIYNKTKQTHKWNEYRESEVVTNDSENSRLWRLILNKNDKL